MIAKRWEYRIIKDGILDKVTTTVPIKDARDRLNELGAMGWELVTINGDGAFIFKRCGDEPEPVVSVRSAA